MRETISILESTAGIELADALSIEHINESIDNIEKLSIESELKHYKAVDIINDVYS